MNCDIIYLTENTVIVGLIFSEGGWEIFAATDVPVYREPDGWQETGNYSLLDEKGDYVMFAEDAFQLAHGRIFIQGDNYVMTVQFANGLAFFRQEFEDLSKIITEKIKEKYITQTQKEHESQ